MGGFEYHQVYSYRFNDGLMRSTPLEQRLLFKIGGTLDAYIVAHESVLTKLFGPDGQNGAKYIGAGLLITAVLRCHVGSVTDELQRAGVCTPREASAKLLRSREVEEDRMQELPL